MHSLARMGPFQRILVATDFSPDAGRALELGAAMTRSFGGTLTLLHVCQMPAYSFANGAMYVPAPELVADILRDADESLRKAKASVTGVAVETVRVEGEPAGEIVRWAADHGVDLIVVGTHGRRGLKRLLLGSVAEHVVRAAGCAVLTVRARPER